MKWVGLDNYVRFLSWPYTPQVVGNTVVLVGCATVLQMSLGLGIALLVNRAMPGRRLMRSIAILPWVVPSIVVAMMFQQFFNGSRLGTLNTLIAAFGIPQQSWLSNSTEAMAVLIAAVTWRGVPLSIILQLGGLQTIRQELYEAASIDGASRWQQFWHITLPSLRGILTINLIIATAGVLNQIDIPFALTGGGPARATEVLAVTLYKQGFEVLDASYASTIATIVLLVNLGLTAVYVKVLRGRHAGA